jgi:riboflavin biosynthesis pyrimidine reductase
MAPLFTQLLPEATSGTAEELISRWDGAQRAPEHRPYTIANFVASVDGAVAVDGRSAALGDDGDRAIFHTLRSEVDAVLAGTNTLRSENYGRIVPLAERRAARVQAGRSPEPIACVITRSGRVPLGIPLFAEPEARVVVFSPVYLDLAGTRAQIDVVRTDPVRSDPLNAALRTLRADFGVSTLLCEGGATLFGSLLAEELIDELFLTLAPKLVGGGGPTLNAGPALPRLAQLRIEWLLARNESLYLRYAVSPQPAA